MDSKKISICCRYVDDLPILNIENFHGISKIIYEDLLQIEITCIGSKANFFNLSLIVTCKGVISDVYDETAQINFAVNECTHLDSNIPMFIYRKLTISQVFRFSK